MISLVREQIRHHRNTTGHFPSAIYMGRETFKRFKSQPGIMDYISADPGFSRIRFDGIVILTVDAEEHLDTGRLA